MYVKGKCRKYIS